MTFNSLYAKTVIKSKSMATEEIHLNEFLEKQLTMFAVKTQLLSNVIGNKAVYTFSMKLLRGWFRCLDESQKSGMVRINIPLARLIIKMANIWSVALPKMTKDTLLFLEEEFQNVRCRYEGRD